ncbi:hypothetical protein [Defluviimonas sp. WL0075]|uniref:Lipoprotein with Yx(FWY)xxD motif n=1 Tax=Albidovulum sediminicola TaxID=2984331 RepID=A0ABT2Z5M9_9RHOB|nr:hypothetical protein [Defluviimonas sp. WL0075]MCV2866403.1 hypothetical protein [Defluviimonas sp. WL0075]
MPRLTAATAAFATAFSVAAGIGFAAAGETVVMTATSGDVTYFTDAQNMTLYTFDKDEAGVSNCYDACAENWPPLLADDGASLPEGFELIARTDGTMQVAYQGQPLYLWIKDENPGDMTGDGVKGVWHTAVAQ